ncbi:predicted protein [Naegleria gruberi]|uniref:Predicted protein n=1 Tax=Naegleria gruberi TaxID=5762 RepID=D2VK23_NAEGR|nr:uncharacterized protein NAEGRDRAFT_69243 [Naegleria gruberi]EFC42784.1 predicted protein [Naegleria gruberi]|eukprot:XP_002675528.1 predicted protein [Naegleria gruberi strain NEG-M]
MQQEQNNLSHKNQVSETFNNSLVDEDGSVVDLSFLDRPLKSKMIFSRANDTFSYYKTIEQCRGDGIKALMDPKVKNLLQILTTPNSRVKLNGGLDFKICTKDQLFPQEFKKFQIGGYYSPTSQHIVICCDRMANPAALKETIAHEMVHVYDLARFGDLEDCNIRACSEIRAYNMTGTCDDAKNQQKYDYSREECAKYHALLSTIPMCGQIQGRVSLEQVFYSCFHDHTPFDMNTPASNPIRSTTVRRPPNSFGSNNNQTAQVDVVIPEEKTSTKRELSRRSSRKQVNYNEQNSDDEEDVEKPKRGSKRKKKKIAKQENSDSESMYVDDDEGGVPTCVRVSQLPKILETLMASIPPNVTLDSYGIQTMLLNCAMDTENFTSEELLTKFCQKVINKHTEFRIKGLKSWQSDDLPNIEKTEVKSEKEEENDDE